MKAEEASIGQRVLSCDDGTPGVIQDLDKDGLGATVLFDDEGELTWQEFDQIYPEII